MDGTIKVWHRLPSDEWVCEHMIESDGPVYTLCCLDEKIVSAGASKSISIWKPQFDRDIHWTRHKVFETEDASDVWTLTVCKGRLISGGNDGVVRVWI